MKVSKLSFLSMMGCFMLAASSCVQINANGEKKIDMGSPVNKTVKISDFNEVSVSNGVKVIFKQEANPGTAKVETYSGCADKLVISNDGKRLNIYFKSGNMSIINSDNSTRRATVTISSPVLDEIKVSSGAVFSMTGTLTDSESIEVSASSGGVANFEKIISRKIELDASSGGSVKVQSAEGKFEADASSGGTIHVAGVKGSELEADASSGGGVTIQAAVCNEVEADASSGGSIGIEGIKADVVDANVSSAASIKLAGTCRVYRENSSSSGSINSSNLSKN